MRLRSKIMILGATILLGAGAAGGLIRWRNAQKPVYETVRVLRKNIREEVIATGSIAPAKTFNLQFENSGTVSHIFVKVGDKVKKGTTLIKLQSADLETALSQTQAALAQAEARLAKLREGSRPEDIRTAQISLANAQTALGDAENNLEAAKTKAAQDVATTYASARTTAITHILSLGNIAEHLRALLDAPPPDFSSRDSQAKTDFTNALPEIRSIASALRSYLATLSAGATHAMIENALVEVANSTLRFGNILETANRALAATPPVFSPGTSLSGSTSTEGALNDFKNKVSGDITTVQSILTSVVNTQNAIANVRTANIAALASAEASRNAATGKAKDARNALAALEAGSRPADVKEAEAALSEAHATVRARQLDLGKATLAAPIEGIITEVPIEIGEVARPGIKALTLVSQSRYQIDVNVPEVDIPKVTIGNASDITLDAFGSEARIKGTVASVDPAQRMVEGVVYYKATILLNEHRNAILPGMTANVTIIGRAEKNALVVPQRVLQERNGRKTARLLRDGKPQEREVQTGLRGAGGEMQILTGLQEGDEIIAFEKKP